MSKPRVPRHAQAALCSGALIALALCLMLTGCGATASATGGGASSAATTTAATHASATDTPPTPHPQPTSLPAGTFTTYTNTAYGYSVSYPQNWAFEGEGADPTAMSFMVFNYNPQTYDQPFSAPPLLKIEIDAAPNPSHLSPLDFFKQSTTGPGEPAVTIQSSQATTVGRHDAEEVISTSSASLYPTITYLIPKGDTMLVITQTNAANGQPSPVFVQMLASFTITG